ncbi:MAG: hypothetical protein CVV50_03895 [Spirochaetae bacterium HGW-Spirochaetae-6]|nr:MAG: hypothetical protein CVV50_03895 [Spirochaetae bacterium HGW-Spirochaetae-6]
MYTFFDFFIKNQKQSNKSRIYILTIFQIHIKFEILDVYKGLKYDDVAITEIYFGGLDVHCFAKGTKIKMADNLDKSIEDLNIGDSVLTFDFTSKKIISAKIEKLVI